MRIISISQAGFTKSSIKRVSFDCIRDPANPKERERKLNEFLKAVALKNDSYGFVRTFVLLQEQGQDKTVLGYYSSTMAQIEPVLLSDLPIKPPPHPVSVFLVGKLAVDRRYQGCLHSKRLMLHAYQSAVKISEVTANCGVIIHPIDEEIKNIYIQSFGFTPLFDQPDTLFISISQIRQWIAKQNLALISV